MQIRTLATGSVAIVAAVANLMAGGGAAPVYSSPASGGKGLSTNNLLGGAGAGTGTAAANLAGGGFGAFDSFGDSLESAVKPLWSLPKLYKGDGLISEFGLHGRYQGQYYWADGPAGSSDDYETRRARIGSHLKLSNGIKLSASFNLELDDSFAFDDLNDIGLFWEGESGLSFGIGKLKPGITAEYATSSKRILTIERSLLVNQLIPSHTGGAFIGGETGRLGWELYGLFGGAEGELEFPSVDGGFNVFAELTYDLTDATTGHFHYLWHEDDADNVAFSDYDNIFSVGQTTATDAGGLITDFIYATGESEVSDVYGVVVMPYYNLSDRLRFVVRGQYAASDDSDGLRLQSRYERPVADGERGDSYWAVYAGLNYHIMGDKLKLMNGFEYSELSGESDFDGWGFFTGVRLYF